MSGTIKFASMALILATAFLIDLRMQNGFREEDYRSKGQVIRKTAAQIKEKWTDHVRLSQLHSTAKLARI